MHDKSNKKIYGSINDTIFNSFIADIKSVSVGLDWGQLSFLGISHLVLFTINMLLVGANEEIWMHSLVLNSFISKYGAGKKSLWKAIIMSAIIFGLIHIPNFFLWNR